MAVFDTSKTNTTVRSEFDTIISLTPDSEEILSISGEIPEEMDVSSDELNLPEINVDDSGYTH